MNPLTEGSWLWRAWRGHSVTFAALFALAMAGVSAVGWFRHVLRELGAPWFFALIFPAVVVAILARKEKEWLPDPEQRSRCARWLAIGSIAAAMIAAKLSPEPPDRSPNPRSRRGGRACSGVERSARMNVLTKAAERIDRRGMKRVYEQIDRWLAGRPAGWMLLVALGAVYAIAYWQHPLYPGTEDDGVARGWWTWSDQQKYLAEARAIAEGRLDPATYVYPIGYPALGAAFVRWMPVNPFFVPNLLLVLAAAAMWWRLARRWLGGVASLAVAAGFLATHRWLVAHTMIVPWNTLATQAALLAGVWLVHATQTPGRGGVETAREAGRPGNDARGGVRTAVLLAVLAGATYVVRPADAVAFGPLLVWATLRLRNGRRVLGVAVGGLAILGAAVALVGALNLGVFGAWRTPYERSAVEMVGFFGYPVSFKLYWLFVDGWPLFRETEPALLWRYPWMFLAPVAAVWWVRREGAGGVAALGAIAINLLLYSNYNDLLPSDIYRFTLVHYLAWWFPVMFLAVAAACRHGWRSGWGWTGLAATAGWVVICAGLRMEPHPVGAQRLADATWRLPGIRPLLIEFEGVPMEQVAALRLEGRALREYREYLAPYVPSDLRLLLGRAGEGDTLSVAAEGPFDRAREPVVSEYRWAWRWDPGDRLGVVRRGER